MTNKDAVEMPEVLFVENDSMQILNWNTGKDLCTKYIRAVRQDGVLSGVRDGLLLSAHAMNRDAMWALVSKQIAALDALIGEKG